MQLLVCLSGQLELLQLQSLMVLLHAAAAARAAQQPLTVRTAAVLKPPSAGHCKRAAAAARRVTQRWVFVGYGRKLHSALHERAAPTTHFAVQRNMHAGGALFLAAGGKQQQYAWNGSKIVAINQDLLNEGYTAAGAQPQ